MEWNHQTDFMMLFLSWLLIKESTPIFQDKGVKEQTDKEEWKASNWIQTH